MRILSISQYADKLDTGRLDNIDIGGVFDMVGLIRIVSFVMGSFRSNVSLFGMVIGILLLMMDMGISMDDVIGESGPLSDCFICFPTGCRIVCQIEVDRCPLYGNKQYLPVGLYFFVYSKNVEHPTQLPLESISLGAVWEREEFETKRGYEAIESTNFFEMVPLPTPSVLYTATCLQSDIPSKSNSKLKVY